MGLKNDIQYVIEEETPDVLAGLLIVLYVLIYAASAILCPLWLPFYLIGRYARKNTEL